MVRSTHFLRNPEIEVNESPNSHKTIQPNMENQRKQDQPIASGPTGRRHANTVTRATDAVSGAEL